MTPSRNCCNFSDDEIDCCEGDESKEDESTSHGHDSMEGEMRREAGGGGGKMGHEGAGFFYDMGSEWMDADYSDDERYEEGAGDRGAVAERRRGEKRATPKGDGGQSIPEY